MKRYISLLKGRMFKGGKIKNSSLFFNKQKIKSLSNDNHLYQKTISNLNERGNIPRNQITFNSLLRKNTIQRKSKDKVLYLNTEDSNLQNFEDCERNNNSDIYEDLFLKLLQENDDIPNIINPNKNNKFNFKYGFYSLFELFSSSPKIKWKNFEISGLIFRILYIISLKIKKEIKYFSIIYNKDLNEIINSYDKKYTQKLRMRNWNIKPGNAYRNFVKTNLKIEMDAKTEVNKVIENMNMKCTDFVVKTNNHGKGKTLIFFGKCLNLYIDDHRNDNSKKYNGISMATEESEFNKNINFEIVYDSEEAARKKCNKNIFKKLNRKTIDSFKTIQSKGFKSTFNLKNKNKLHGGSTDKFCATATLYKQYKNLILNESDKNNKDTKSNKNLNTSNNISSKSNSNLLPKIRSKSKGNIISLPNEPKIKKYRNFFKSFSVFKDGNSKKNKQRNIKNFLTRKDYDFYY